MDFDCYGFPQSLSTKQTARLQTRAWVTQNQWECRFPTTAAAIAAPAGLVMETVIAHGVLPGIRADLWIAWHRRRSCSAPTSSYASLVSQCSTIPDSIARQIELDLPRTFSEQRDFAASVAASYSTFDGSRAGLDDALAAAAASGSADVGSGGLHDALRRMLRCFALKHPHLGYLQSMNFLAGFFLLLLGSTREAEAFELFDALASEWLAGYYSEDMGVLKVRFFRVSWGRRSSRCVAHSVAWGRVAVPPPPGGVAYYTILYWWTVSLKSFVHVRNAFALLLWCAGRLRSI